ncbi:Sulfolipid sulfoquinovosyldiacylglycerol biosynthesis protein [Haloplasma contractile SSD-17B]|uniref:Sulfolipid sulfoquinovosyldiacylglycerol biosynthesis protein n=2 Tax=Haloplasma TaxID=471824 RepID=U2DZA9_9MOLU|nr:Sulfolipid sulfoquinovosyldiacylglycerol biosynthesis protein [Haloplasma contractile SSD-17B]
MLQETIKEKELDDIVTLTGSIPPIDVVKFYLASDLFIFSSQSETQGMVLLEAMAGGCPVVAIRSSGVDDVIVNDSNGYKTKPEVEAWANRIIQLLEDSDKLKEMSKEATQFAKQYGIEEMARHVEDIYYKKIKQHKAYTKKMNECDEENCD